MYFFVFYSEPFIGQKPFIHKQANRLEKNPPRRPPPPRGSFNELDNDGKGEFLGEYNRPNNLGGPRRPPPPPPPPPRGPPRGPPIIPPQQRLPPHLNRGPPIPQGPPPFPPHLNRRPGDPPPFSEQDGYVYNRPKNPLLLPGEGGFGVGQNSEENKDLLGKRPPFSRPPSFFPPPPPFQPGRPPRPGRPEFGKTFDENLFKSLIAIQI